RAAGNGDPRDADRGDRRRWQHPARLRREHGACRLLPVALLRLRPRRRALPCLWHADPADSPAAARELFLPGLPARLTVCDPRAASAGRRLPAAVRRSQPTRRWLVSHGRRRPLEPLVYTRPMSLI